MLASINPLGERGRQQRYPITIAAFIAASAVGGALLGTALGAIGSTFTTPALAFAAVAVIGAIGLAMDHGSLGTRVPGPRRQVEERWLSTYRGWVYGAGFGFQLGLAFTTIVSASATWLAFTCALLSGSPVGGFVVGATYGLVRALPVLSTARVRDPGALRSLMRGIDRLGPRVTMATTSVQCAAVVATALIVVGLIVVGRIGAR